MTASTHGTHRTMTRPVVIAGLVTVGATALTLPFAATAHAEDTHAGVVATAEQTTSPTAYTPTTGTLAPDSGTPDSGAPEGDAPAKEPQAPEEPEEPQAPEAGVTDGRADGFTADTGRGEEYGDDGSLVVIDKAEQPKPEPATDEDIEGWINEALEIMDEEGIPGTYEGIHRNLMRESAGDPLTINLWDTNAEQDIPSKGLLQVIDPTFDQYHVDGTSENIYDPVANITAAANYAADRYGSMDNVDSAY
ncbi:transglycosylase SLT domain-containing protein [Streptomyces sedi]|uniref:Transglycosylase SLT domain-containing protein n=2 Tax=Streptomyces TaxID=1883 RepID=A0A5C4VEM0_9ACTN|nr:transglycosylase SLT domain-containing protein [Streptomyces sedi]TNM34377.1 hypothetical protein FH715_01475 [Streptomyces sedi]